MLFTPVLAALLLTGPFPSPGDTPRVLATRRLSDRTPGFQDVLDPGDSFGASVAEIGDLDGDGVRDLAVGAPGDDDGYESRNRPGNRGAVYVLFRRADGSVRARQKISATSGGLGATLEELGGFGRAVAGLGDVDGDGVPDLAIGSPNDTQGPAGSRGIVWICLLRRNGAVKSVTALQLSTPGIAVPRRAGLGSVLAGAGDWNGDGVPDLMAGCQERSDLLWMIFLARDGSVLSSRRSAVGLGRNGDAAAWLDDLDGDGLRELALARDGQVSVHFLDASGGARKSLDVFSLPRHLALAAGDLDGDGRRELALGVMGSTGLDVLRLNADGTLASEQPYFPVGVFGSTGTFEFGASIAFLGDANGDGLPELAFGSPADFTGPAGGVLHTCAFGPGPAFLDVGRQSSESGAMESTLDPGEGFGSSAVAVGDLDGNGVVDLAFGAPEAPVLPRSRATGVVWLWLMETDGRVKARRRIGPGEAGFTGIVRPGDRFGASLAALGDLDADGTPELAVGAPRDDGGLGAGADAGAVWILFLRPDGGVKGHLRITAGRGGFHGTLHAADGFGSALAAAGDLDGNGTCDLLVGAPGDDDGGSRSGAAWILHLRRDGSARFEQKVSALEGGFGGALAAGSRFGGALAAPGDIDGDGQVDLAIGAVGDESVWVLFLDGTSRVRAWQRIARREGTLTGFGSALAGPGDLDGDGVPDLAVGAPGNDDLAVDSGAVWILTLEQTGAVAAQVKVRTGLAGFGGALGDRHRFGTSLAVLGDVSGDGVPDLLAGAPGADGARPDHGTFWLLALDALAVLDFEHRSDFTPTVDGLALPSGARVTRLLTLRSEGTNLGPALFDSRPGGPNDPSQDPDLLVGRGKVLILQNPLEPVQTFPGIFDRPNDEPGGGVLRFELDRPVSARSIALVDIDTGSAAQVRLIDQGGGVRHFDVPAGWTGDRLVDRTAGVRTLDLTTLAPQPGERGTATAFESPGFLAAGVVAIEVLLAGSGAVDDLVLDPR